jgi:hypothetical protein
VADGGGSGERGSENIFVNFEVHPLHLSTPISEVAIQSSVPLDINSLEDLYVSNLLWCTSRYSFVCRG